MCGAGIKGIARRLAVAVGGSAAVALIALLLRSSWAPALTVVAGAILMGWIVGEVLILNQPVEPTWIEIAFFAIGLAMSVLGVFARGRVAEPPEVGL